MIYLTFLINLIKSTWSDQMKHLFQANTVIEMCGLNTRKGENEDENGTVGWNREETEVSGEKVTAETEERRR